MSVQSIGFNDLRYYFISVIILQNLYDVLLGYLKVKLALRTQVSEESLYIILM
jgi:hypothetical protein